MENQEFKAVGTYSFELVRDGKVIDSWEEKNIVVNGGLNYILDSALSNGTAFASHYLVLFTNNYTPIATTVITDLTQVTTAVTEATRPIWTEGGAVSQSITNSASPAAFTFNTGATVYGAGLVHGSSTKGDTASTTLISASKFTASRTVIASDVLNVTYTLSISSS